MKRHNDSWDREKKIHKVVKGNKVGKHRKSIYNMLEDEEEDSNSDSDYVEYDLNEAQKENTH